MKFVLRMLVSAAAVFGVAYVSGGALLRVDAFWPAAVYAAIALAVVNAVVKPVVQVLAFPVTVLTLGLFALVVNAFMLYIVDWVVPGVSTTGFWQTVVASVLISIVSSLAGKAIEGGDE
ncbi:MAG: phage holin family protein [Anaerosomatales bacterium]|nr:phage holin family protein [Anaerosomatales bacterium]